MTMKTIKEIDLALKDEPGKLSGVIDLLSANGLRIIAFHVAPRRDQGHINLVPDDPDKALSLLTSAGFDLETREVIACEVPEHPGGLNAVLKPLKEAGINVDYVYPCLSPGDATVLIMGLQPLEAAARALERNWIRILGPEVYSM